MVDGPSRVNVSLSPEHASAGDITVCWLLFRGIVMRHLGRLADAVLMFRLVWLLRSLASDSTFVVPAALLYHAELIMDTKTATSKITCTVAATAVIARGQRAVERLRSFEYDGFYIPAIQSMHAKITARNV